MSLDTIQFLPHRKLGCQEEMFPPSLLPATFLSVGI